MSLTATRKTLAWLLLLIYLLLGVGGAHAFVWCQDATGDSRVEFNLSGRCAPNCGDEAPAQPVEPESLQQQTAADCNDQSTSPQQYRSRGFDSGQDLPALVGSLLLLPPYPHPTQIQVRLLRAPQPPPSQVLATIGYTLLLI
ncbi:MAG: hypothetical protein ACYDAI_18685 [Trichloromonadaceae bacterium]